MEIDGMEWITLREAEQIVGRSRRQIWRYIYDGLWDTRAVMDEMNRQVTYIKMVDVLRKKAEIETAPNLNHVQTGGRAITGASEGGETDLTAIKQLLERIVANQDYQNSLIKKCLYIIAAGITALTACSILNIIVK